MPSSHTDLLPVCVVMQHCSLCNLTTQLGFHQINSNDFLAVFDFFENSHGGVLQVNFEERGREYRPKFWSSPKHREWLKKSTAMSSVATVAAKPGADGDDKSRKKRKRRGTYNMPTTPFRNGGQGGIGFGNSSGGSGLATTGGGSGTWSIANTSMVGVGSGGLVAAATPVLTTPFSTGCSNCLCNRCRCINPNIRTFQNAGCYLCPCIWCMQKKLSMAWGVL